MSCEDQQADHAAQFVLAEMIAFRFQIDQLAEQVILRILALLLDQLILIPRRVDLIALFWRHAENIADHVNRQWVSEVAHYVHLAIWLYAVKKLIGNALDAWSQPLDIARCE